MLALHENALLAALKGHRTATKIKTVESLPKAMGDKLLARYQVEAPALYVVPGRITVKDDQAYLEFTVAGIVRNVAGQAQARKGDGIDLGCDHLLRIAIKAINRKTLGVCSWSLASAEMADDDAFLTAGISAIEMKFSSSAIDLEADYTEQEIAELEDFLLLHADIDSPADAGAIEYASWLAEPPDYTNTQPDLQMDVSLPGATA
ncbi:MAG: hypothetical protein Q8N06_06665 [Hydrogenophaga sp.]|nr:hypothetical protein [Hydrogenophaga sp.]